MMDELKRYPAKKRFHLVQGRDKLSYPEDHEWYTTIDQAMHRDDYEYLAVSEWAGKSCRSPHIVPNGVDRSFWLPVPFANLFPEFRILIEASSGDKYKGVEEALEAANRLRENHQNVKIWLLGDNFGRVKYPVDQRLSGDNDTKVKHAYQNATVLVKATWFDGFGLPHLEAMACGLPLVTTRAGGNEMFCQDDKNCLMADPHDVDRITKNLEDLHLSVALRKRLTQGGLLTAREFSWGRSVDRLLAAVGE